ncbi:MAG: hypothetical protein QG564_754 [Campylobacterota bacterium]|nr:hypothetical protein [Campylobacterota bacterium]
MPYAEKWRHIIVKIALYKLIKNAYEATRKTLVTSHTKYAARILILVF